MDKRFFSLLIVVCFALAEAGCASKHVEYVEMPLQTGSTIHRRVAVQTSTLKKTKSKETKRKETKRVEPEPEPTPTPPEEESTTPDRFR
jgi:cell division septation protein DedD